jgi:nucleoside-triphosphatase THEP1
MSLHKIYLFCEAIHSGKTTQLQQWLRNKTDQVSGILTPDKDGKRQLYDIARNEYHELQMDENAPEKEILEIGKYRFAKEGFAKAQEILRRSLEENTEWMVVDEVGKLELNEQTGLEPALGEVIRFYQNGDAKGKLILVIRNYLLDEAVEVYGLNRDMLIHKNFFE